MIYNTLTELLEHHPDAKGFLNNLAEKRDPLTRLIFADLLDENGFPNAAAGQRWAAKHNKWPMKVDEYNTPPRQGGWYYRSRHFNNTPDREMHELPHAFNDATIIKNGDFGLEHRSIWDQPGHDMTENEYDFLHASNQLPWDEEGEPMRLHDR